MELDSDTLADLTQDGDTVELDDGRTLRLRLTADDMTAADDGDWYGAIAPVRWAHRYDADYHQQPERPNGFTGNAEKLHYGRGEVVWWEPPSDVKRGTDGFTTLRATLRDVLEYGYVVVSLELCRGTDAYGRPVVVDVASIGGVEAMARDDYMREIVSELAAELTDDETETTQTRLEYLRGQIRAERISYAEISELQGMADLIDRGDTELLEWAGVPEFADDDETAPDWSAASDDELASALDGLADGQDDDLGQMLHAAANRLRIAR